MGEVPRGDAIDDDPTERSRAAELLRSMPERYGQRFTPAAVREHARVVFDRRAGLARVGLFAGDSGGPALCVVTEDAPGVLAAISASLMLEGFDVMQAEAFIRRDTGGRPEAVVAFWVRRALADHRGPLTQADADAVQATLVPLLRGEVGVRRARASEVPTPAAAETSVRFIERDVEPWLTLELHTNDRSGLLVAVTAALLDEDVQITGSQITTDGTRVRDRFDLVAVDGTRIPRERMQEIQLAVLAAVDGY